jgi:hypothetical protein
MRMGETNGDHRVPAIKVKIGLAFFVIDVVALAFDGFEVVEWIYVEEFHYCCVFSCLPTNEFVG